nr:TonB-dependent receptor [Prevotella sp. OH937_COT-195]
MCLACFNVSHAQSVVYGKITDAVTGDALFGASVNLENTMVGTVSDVDGKYVMQVPAGMKKRLRINYVGYKTRLVGKGILNGRDSIRCDIELSPSAHQLSDVVIVGHNEARKLRESAMPVSVISANQLQGTASSINDVIARTAGVTVRNTGGVGSASRVSVRGLEGKRMGMFVDENPLGQMSNYITLNDIPTDMIERIEIYKGIVPYKFGGSALGGAVNVVTKEYPPVYMDFGYEISSFNTHKFDAVVKRTDSKSGLQFGIGGGYTRSDNNYKMRLQNIDNRIVKRNHDKYGKLLLGGSVKAVKWWFDEIKLELVYSRTRQEMQGIDFDIREAYNHSSSLLAGLTLKRDNFLLPGLDFDFDFNYNAGWFGLCDKAMHRYDWDGKEYPPVSSYGGEEGSFPSDGKNRSHDFATKLNLNYIMDEHHSFNLNVFGSHTKQMPKDELMDKALGFSANFPSRMSNLTVGLSYDLALFDGKLQSATTVKNFFFTSKSKMLPNYYISKPVEAKTNKDFWGWSEAVRYKLTRDLIVKASFSSEVRIPTTEELVGNGYSILPSASLVPERCNGVNLGLLYHKNNAYGFVEAEINTFFNHLKDMIRFTADIIPTMAIYRNFGSVRTRGIEAEMKGDVLPFLYFYVNGTLQDLRDVRRTLPGTNVENPTKNKRMPNIPYLMANGGLDIHRENLFGGKRQNTRFLFDMSYIHEYFYDFEMSVSQDRKIPTMLTMDASIEHSFMNNRWTVTLKAKNITNREVFSELNRPLPGRSFGVKLRYLFK